MKLTQEQMNEVAKQATALARKIELFECHNRNDWGGWKTKKAESRFNQMKKELERLDSQIEDLN